MESPEDNIIVIQVDKEITALFKTFLEVMEDVKKDHSIMLDKLQAGIEPKLVSAADSLTDAKYEQYRKRILDKGNECKRNLTMFLGFFDSVINKEKVAEAATHKKVIKRVVSQPTIIYNKEQV